MAFFSFLRRLLREQPFRFLLVVVSLTIAALLEGLALILLAPLLTLAGGAETANSGGMLVTVVRTSFTRFGFPFEIPTILVVIFILGVGQQVFTVIQQKLFYGSLYRFEANLRRRLYASFFEAGWPFFLRQKIGNLTNVLTAEVTRAGEAYSLVHVIISMAIVIVAYLGLAISLSWQMTLTAGLVGFSLAIVVRKRVARATVFGTNITTANAELQGAAAEHIQGAKLIKSYMGEDRAIADFDARLHNVARSYYGAQMNGVLVKSLYDVSIITVLCLGVYAATSYFKMPMAELILFLLIFYRIAPRFSNTQANLNGFLSTMPALNRIDEMVEEASSFKEHFGSHKVAELLSAATFDNIGFSYLPDRPVLENINIDIKARKTTAIVGGSGSGKSTLVDLLMGLITTNQGRLLIDGVDIRDADIKSWRSLIGYVAQDTFLFHSSVIDNVRWGFPDATDEQIHEACELAHADEFIRRLPEGYDTLVGDRGVKLSGGQRQRLALARALARKPQLLVLDEATSALDGESEQKIKAAVDSLARSTTIVIVTHRLATIKNADYIYVVEDGRVVEQGAWAELEKLDGRFNELKRTQELSRQT